MYSLRGSIGQAPKVDVFTFHGLSEELATRTGIGLTKRHAEQDYWDVELPQALSDAIERLPEHVGEWVAGIDA